LLPDPYFPPLAQDHSTRLRFLFATVNGPAEGHEQGEAQRSRVEWLPL
jgi:hypothetical protein